VTKIEMRPRFKVTQPSTCIFHEAPGLLFVAIENGRFRRMLGA
jgi:hypothetical protein